VQLSCWCSSSEADKQNRVKWQVQQLMLLLPCDRTVQSVDCVVVKMSYFAGLLLNEGVNWILKHLIKELRPLQSQRTAFFYCKF